MTRAIRFVLVLLVVAVIVGLPAGYASYRRTHFRNLRVVKPGLLYRSGQLTATGLDRVVNDYGIKTVVSLRDTKVEGKQPPDAAEEEACRKLDIKYLRLAPKEWWGRPNAPIPVDANIARFLAVMDDPSNYPVLVHCFAGIHRTGTMCAIFRMEYHRWSPDAAIDEMQLYGFDPADMHEHIEGYLRSYKPRGKK